MKDQFAIDERARHCTHPYDYHSIMHYGPHAFNHNGEYTITPRDNKKPIVFGAPTYSKWDIHDVREMYCPEQMTNHLAEKLFEIYPDCGKVSSKVNSRRSKRWGGTPAEQEEFPWVAHIQTYPIVKDSPSPRSASFVTDRVLLTSASALLQKNNTFFERDSLKIHLRPFQKTHNILNKIHKMYIRDIKAVHIHPQFRHLPNRQFENDLAVIELELSVDLKVFEVLPICLPRKDFSPTRRSETENKQIKCKMGGWGKIRHKEFTEELHSNDLLLYKPEVCTDMLGYNFNRNTNLCIGNHKIYEPEQNACKGDEGASIVCHNHELNPYELAAVVSWTDNANDYSYCDRKPWAATNIFLFSNSWLYELFETEDLFTRNPEKCPGDLLKHNFNWERDVKLQSTGSISIRALPVKTYEECLQHCCDDAQCQAVNHKRTRPRTCQLLTAAPDCKKTENYVNNELLENNAYTFFHYRKC